MKLFSFLRFLCIGLVFFATAQVRADFTLLHLQTSHLAPAELEELLAAQADILCLQNLPRETIHACSPTLKSRYAYLYTFTDPDSPPSSHLLIASKYRLANPQFNGFVQTGDSVEGYFDFTVTEGAALLGHVYISQLEPGEFSELRVAQLTQILEKMHSDLSTCENEHMPYLLCGNLHADPSTDSLVRTYFQTQGENVALLRTSCDHRLSATPLPNHPTALLATLALRDPLDYLCGRTSAFGDSAQLLARGRADLSARTDNEGNASVEASVEVSEKTESGVEYSANAGVEVKRDNEGNVTAEGKVGGTVRW